MRQLPHKVTLLASVGSGLEYYDYVIFGMLASFISAQFFPKENHYTALMATFMLFAVSNFVRPVGAIVFGLLGDTYGRKKTFSQTLLLMAIATFGIGLTPTFAAVGLMATILFCAFRIGQGIIFGAELPGAVTFLWEHVNHDRRGLYNGLMIAAVGISVAFGSFVTWSLSKCLTDNQIADWGWRLPFLFGGLLAIIGFMIRRHTSETPYFINRPEKSKNTIHELVVSYPLSIVLSIGTILFPACLITFFLVLPVYLKDVFHYQLSNIYLVITGGYILSAIFLPIFGWLSDRIGRKKLLVVTLVLAIVACPLLFGILKYQTISVLVVFVGVWQILVAALAANYFVILPEAFSTSVRYTGTAFCYNIAYSIAALTPLAINFFYGRLHQTNYVPWLFSIIGLLTLICVTFLKKAE